MTDYERGQWAGYNRIMALLQTYDSNTIPRKRLYSDIMELRPLEDRPLPDYVSEQEEEST